MSLLRIEHLTQYDYARPVAFGRHRLVLRPREGHDVRVESMRLEISPAHRLEWTRDVFGNSVAIVDFLVEAAAADDHAAKWSSSAGCRCRRMMPSSRGACRFPLTYDPLEATIAATYQAATYPDDRRRGASVARSRSCPLPAHSMPRA